MTQLKLDTALLQKIQGLLSEHDAEARDPGLMVQYLAAVIGIVVGNQPVAAEQRHQFIDQLAQFSRQVCDDTSAPAQQPPAQEAFGVWKPGQ